jgi:hypothetical protein
VATSQGSGQSTCSCVRPPVRLCNARASFAEGWGDLDRGCGVQVDALLRPRAPTLRLLFRICCTPASALLPRPASMSVDHWLLLLHQSHLLVRVRGVHIPCGFLVALLRCQAAGVERPAHMQARVRGQGGGGGLGLDDEQAKLCFYQSRMLVHDDADVEKVEGLAFADFLEALGRVADATSLVTARELRELRYPSVRDFMLATEAATEARPRPSRG